MILIDLVHVYALIVLPLGIERFALLQNIFLVLLHTTVKQTLFFCFLFFAVSFRASKVV